MKCRICRTGVSSTEVLRAVVSPWIREYLSLKNKLTDLHICPVCKGGAFAVVYSDEQMISLYRDYRGESYTRIRNKWEKWYTTEYNASHESQDLVSKRKSHLQEFLNENGVSKIRSVLDIGGDTGQYIPNFQDTTKKYVMDYSNRVLTPGVSRISSLDELQNTDLIIFAHTLEHISNPLETISLLLARTKHLYIEVPSGVPSSSRIRKSRAGQLVLIILSISPKVWRLISKPTAGRIFQFRLLQQSEHLNFFCERTFIKLSQELDSKLIMRSICIPTPDGKTSLVIQALFEKNSFQ